MNEWMKAAAGAAVVLGLAMLAACGGGTDHTKAQVRLVNASSGYSALDMSVDDTRRFSSVAYGASADYVEIDPAKTSTVISRPNSATSLASFTPSYRKDQNFSVLAYGGEGTLKTLVLDDNTGAPADGKTLLRVVNAAPDAGKLDVYLTGSGETLNEAVAVQTDAALGVPSGYTPVNSSTWRLQVTATNSKTDVRLDVAALSLGNGNVTTLVLTPGRGGVLVNALLLVDRGGIVRADNTQARVRAVAGVSNGGAVTASMAGTTLMNGDAAPAINASYTLVGAGTQPVAVSVDGTAAALASASLAAGGDYTLLVYGLPGAPTAGVIEDDNTLPIDSTGAKLRLVHGLADQGGTLSLKVDLAPVANGVAPGHASAYAAVSASTTAELTVTTPGVADPLVDLIDRTILANGNYTMFVVGTMASTKSILSKDR